MKNQVLISISAIFWGLTVLSLPHHSWPGEDLDLKNLQGRIETLELLLQPPEVTEAALAAEKKPLLFETLREKKFLEGIEIIPGVALSGLLEAEAEYENISRNEGQDEKNSDIKLATFELGLEVAAIKYVRAHALLLWEEDDTEPIDLDEGFITLGAEEDYPYSLSAGKMYVPFGVFESHFISDLLTLELGETQAVAALLGIEQDLFSAFLGAFRGDVQKSGKDSRMDSLVAAFNLTPVEGLAAGVSYLTDIADTDGLTDLIPEAEVEEYVGGISAYFIFEIGPFTLNGEYLGALKRFENIPDPEGKGTDLEGKEPKAWNLELAWVFVEDWEAALRYEGSDDFPEFPKNQGGVCVTRGIFPNTSLSAEYLYGKFENGDKRNLTTAQLAFEF